MQHAAANERDVGMMERCIALSRTAERHREFPFACVICRDDDVLAESINRVAQDSDITRHAEMVAISAAQRRLGRLRLTGCTLYSNVEPCVMCAMAIRETGIGRVVFAIDSPVMGGASRWNVLGDEVLSKAMPFFYRKPPDVVRGLLAGEAEQVWSEWHPLLWQIVRRRGLFGGMSRAGDERGPGG